MCRYCLVYRAFRPDTKLCEMKTEGWIMHGNGQRLKVPLQDGYNKKAPVGQVLYIVK